MAKARKILRHAKAIKNIAAVTKTMGMVSTVRFKKTYDRATASKPYSQRLVDLVADVIERSTEINHPLLRVDETVKTDVLLAITGNRGLAGAYNNSIVRLATERIAQMKQGGYKVRIFSSGKKGTGALRSRGYEVERDFTNFDFWPKVADVNALADELMNEFLAGRISGLEVAYTQFISTGSQKPAIAQILPLTQLDRPKPLVAPPQHPAPYEFLPSSNEILETLLPATVRLRLFQCFIDASVSEQICRMTAMQAATENAEEMIHHLTVQYNRARQSQITTELAEIMGGSEGVA